MTLGCPVCSGLGYLLGQLGRLLWFRCRGCGIEFSCERAECLHTTPDAW